MSSSNDVSPETCSDILVLGERHMIAVLLYLRDHEGCMKSDIYRALTRTPRFPEKLDLLESSGLITVDDIDRRATCIRLTDKGRRISDHLVEMQAIMADTGT